MAKLYNLARMTTATAGTGIITLGSAVSGFLTFAQAGIADGDVISYAIRDGSNSEIGTGTYTASGTTLTRTVTQSTNSNGLISLSGTAQVFITPNSGNFALSALSDVNIAEGSAIHGKSLYWDNTSSKWVTSLPVPSVTSWRVRNIVAGDGSEWTTIAEVQFRTTAGTPLVPSGGTVLAGSPGYAGAGGSAASNAFDNITTTHSRHDNFGGLQSTDWLGYQFASAIQVAEVAITSSDVTLQNNEAPSNFVIEYLDPVSSNWVALNYYTSTSWALSTTRTFAVSGAAALQVANLADYSGSPADTQALVWSVSTHKWSPTSILSTATPLVNGSAAVGTSALLARQDHVHPQDLAAATYTGTQTLVAGGTTTAPLKFQSGTNLTTPAAGAVEYDGTCFYSSMAASTRAVIASEQVMVLNAAYTLTSQTAAQKLFNSTTNGTVTLPVGSYEFECLFSLTAMSATSGSFGFAFAGTATFTQAWWAFAVKALTSQATANAPSVTFNTAANVTLVTASTNIVGECIIKGIIRVTVTGTLIPQVSLGVAAAAVVGINSYFKIKPLGSATVTNVGNWS